MNKKGKLIVLYGINNLGKTTQLKLLVDYLKNKKKKKVYSMKVPVYELKPTGPAINEYLREGNKYDLTPREVQILYAMNRTQFAPKLEELLEEYDFVVFEDYFGTSFAWGIGAGVSKQFLYEINSHLRVPDVSILLDGERFIEGVEVTHKHETDNKLTDKVRQAHLEIGEELGWYKVNANRSIEEVNHDIIEVIDNLIRP